MESLIISILFSLGVSSIFAYFQISNFKKTQFYIKLYQNFFNKSEKYSTISLNEDDENDMSQLKQVGANGSDLNKLIQQINHYISKTKGTTDFAIIQNKVERFLSLRFEQATSRIAFPTYIGLMGTFAGVLMGIMGFLYGISNENGISDKAITNLLGGIIVSMLTSFLGLCLTTKNSASSSNARKQIEENKNEFYDFIQTELMPTLDVSMVTAISKLHDTVDKFGPAFDRIIKKFHTTFEECTKAFGNDFKEQVKAVSGAVFVMGKNMDKINLNIELQSKLIHSLESDKLIKGMDKYMEAADHFAGITQSLDKFEEARRMMLAAAQEAITIQNQYSESLNIPREIAIRINQILDRIKDFENNVNETGRALNQREILGNDVIESIQNQIKGISRKGKIADDYLDVADEKLIELFSDQTKVISEMNNKYKQAIEGHIEGFESMITQQTEELKKRHQLFLHALEDRFNVEDVRKEFTNLQKLNLLEDVKKKLDVFGNLDTKLEKLDSIEKELEVMLNSIVKPENIKSEIKGIQNILQECKTNLANPEFNNVRNKLDELKKELQELNNNIKEPAKKNGGFGSWFNKNDNR